jgi:hypothetical protein
VIDEESKASTAPLMLLAPLSKHDPATCRAIVEVLLAAGVSTAQVDNNMSNVLHNAVSQVLPRPCPHPLSSPPDYTR